ncbi:Hypothetical protein SRAE_0000054600 [Strongyloides ratti]|uniref:Uncharacterized protein n=1 Tax=Strongyloides ratti TaxID=34506 RepID=A0A090KZW2_STRRB|nr:Hypothetical protein SRAE_0000054600 [Strongyloides ratti]CEF61422.1 Hypothetical protein SRAE_0000054600 [Strongyloides ratti]
MLPVGRKAQKPDEFDNKFKEGVVKAKKIWVHEMKDENDKARRFSIIKNTNVGADNLSRDIDMESLELQNNVVNQINVMDKGEIPIIVKRPRGRSKNVPKTIPLIVKEGKKRGRKKERRKIGTLWF